MWKNRTVEKILLENLLAGSRGDSNSNRRGSMSEEADNYIPCACPAALPAVSLFHVNFIPSRIFIFRFINSREVFANLSKIRPLKT